jgi:hypothetical protein
MSEYAKRDECGHIFKCGCKFVHFYPEESAEWVACPLHSNPKTLLEMAKIALEAIEEGIDPNFAYTVCEPLEKAIKACEEPKE